MCAKELLVLLTVSVKPPNKALNNVLDLGIPSLPDHEVGDMSTKFSPPTDAVVNAQTRQVFCG